MVTFGHFTTDFYNGFLAPLLPLIVVKLNLSLALAGLLLSIFSISSSLVQPITGVISDRLSRNYFLVFGPLITAIFMGLLGWVNRYSTLILILVMSGLGTAMFHPAGAAAVGTVNHCRKGFSMSVFNMAGALGVALGSLVIIPITDRYGIKSAIFTMLLSLIFSIYAGQFFLARKTDPVISEPMSQHQNRSKLNRLLLINLYLMVVIRATMVQSFAGFIPLYLTSKGESHVFGGTALAIFQLFTTTGILIGGYLFDRIGSKKTLQLSFVTVLPCALGFINLPMGSNLVCLALLGLFIQLSTSVNIVLGQQILPRQASLVSSIMMGMGWGASGLLMTPIGALADKIGLYWTLTLISFFSLVGMMLVKIFAIQQRRIVFQTV
ncbi:MAG: MFS transporter [candidate division KSB1 bacterium]|nr:MFS transporter [candidate division KSB1 bacterium]MDZ7334883.1 MFS transporter [candidate division KSB1 bacterium]MDZ7357339.1 MFS transporter [candidate division KSB1 bacterium]MDZ7376379.1 MFS transporter [candidate division KSB1 bacterium]MDZ7399339.1 MFS transporter [candidate division KSB1 bacterium]